MSSSQEQKDRAWELFIDHAIIATCQLHQALERLRSMGALDKAEEEMIQDEMLLESSAELSASVAEAALSQAEEEEYPIWMSDEPIVDVVCDPKPVNVVEEQEL